MWVKVNVPVDTGISGLVSALSTFPSQETIESCEGYAGTALHGRWRHVLDLEDAGFTRNADLEQYLILLYYLAQRGQRYTWCPWWQCKSTCIGPGAMLIEFKTRARSVVRKLGLVPLLDKIRSVWRVGYEDSFSSALLREIKSSDCVWDIGANVGYYSQRIAPLAGHVVAFEPVQETFSCLSKLALPNATFVNAALADVEGMLPMSIANDASSLAVLSGNIAEVRVVRGDDLEVPQPNIVKIDVEGFEWEVISGMQTRLRAPECRAVFCEVHFDVLEKRGLRQAPAKIVEQLRSLGFAKVHWLDASHISAYKS